MTNHSRALARGTLLSVILRWAIKGIGLVSTIVLARFLTPADYGVMVMATLVIGLVEIFFYTSADNALLRREDPPEALINSAWTLRLIQAVMVASIVALLSPVAAYYFRDERVTPVMLLLCFGIVFSALANIGPLLARKNLEFGLEVRLGISAKLLSFFATLLSAYLLKSYWALVIGIYVGHISGVWLSYVLHPYRPRWDTSHIRELWSFSQWLLLSSIGSFFGKKLDELILGRIGSAKDLGVYNLASELGQTVTVEISAPVNRSLFPVLSSMRNDKPGRLALFFYTLGLINTFTIPAGIGLCMVAAPFVQTILGTTWLEVIPVLEVFALQGSIRFLVSPYYVWFMAVDRTKFLAFMSWMELLFFLIFAAFLHTYGILGLAWARLLTTLITVSIWVVVGRKEGLPARTLAKSLVRPVFAGAVMGATLWLMQSWVATEPAYLQLTLLMASGALVYTLALLLVWLVLGRPEGIEKSLLSRITG